MQNIKVKYIKYIPRLNEMEDLTLYISREFSTASHKCICGCGEEVVTPLGKGFWTLKDLNNRVSLSPSIGNWNFPCQSHYFIKNNKIILAEQMNKKEITILQKEEQQQIKYIYKNDSIFINIYKYIKNIFYRNKN